MHQVRQTPWTHRLPVKGQQKQIPLELGQYGPDCCALHPQLTGDSDSTLICSLFATEYRSSRTLSVNITELSPHQSDVPVKGRGSVHHSQAQSSGACPGVFRKSAVAVTIDECDHYISFQLTIPSGTIEEAGCLTYADNGRAEDSDPTPSGAAQRSSR